jgi:hypothetical protein
MIDVFSGGFQRREDHLSQIVACVVCLDGIVRHCSSSICLIRRPWQPASVAREKRLSRCNHARGKHPFETTDSVAEIGQLLADPDQIG